MEQPADKGASDHSPALHAGRRTEALIGLLAVVALSVLFSAVCFRLTPVVTLSPIAGIAAGLACRRLPDAGASAALGVGVGSLIVAATTRLAIPPLDAMAPVIGITMLCATAVAIGCAWLRTVSERMPPILAFLGVALLVASSWSVSVQSMSTLDPATGATYAKRLVLAKPIVPNVTDEDLYQDALTRMHQGQGYYQAMGSALSEANGARPGTDHDVSLSFAPAWRLPTVFVILAQLPADGISFVLATLAIGSIASVAAYWLARAYVSRALSLVAAAGVASMYSGLSEGQQLFQVEVWAGAFVLLSAALFAWTDRRPSGVGLLWASAAAATLAAATRELAAVYLLLGLAATLSSPLGRRASRWLPWAVGAGVFATVYALHARAVATIYPTLAHWSSTGHSKWLDLSALGGLAVVDRVGSALSLSVAATLLFVVAGVLGSVVAPRGIATRIYLGSAVVGGMLVVTFFHPPGPLVAGLPAGYWGQLVMPTVFSAVPLLGALVLRESADSAGTAPTSS